MCSLSGPWCCRSPSAAPARSPRCRRRAPQRPLGLLLQRDPTAAEPGPDGLHGVGTAAAVLRYVAARRAPITLSARAMRFRVVEFLDGHPYLAARMSGSRIASV